MTSSRCSAGGGLSPHLKGEGGFCEQAHAPAHKHPGAVLPTLWQAPACLHLSPCTSHHRAGPALSARSRQTLMPRISAATARPCPSTSTPPGSARRATSAGCGALSVRPVHSTSLWRVGLHMPPSTRSLADWHALPPCGRLLLIALHPAQTMPAPSQTSTLSACSSSLPG